MGYHGRFTLEYHILWCKISANVFANSPVQVVVHWIGKDLAILSWQGERYGGRDWKKGPSGNLKSEAAAASKQYKRAGHLASKPPCLDLLGLTQLFFSFKPGHFRAELRRVHEQGETGWEYGPWYSCSVRWFHWKQLAWQTTTDHCRSIDNWTQWRITITV